MQQTTVQSLIESHASFRSIQTGWIVGKCALCHDYKERAGFKFENGQVIYNCWNCSTASRYEEFSGKMSKKFKSILTAYGIESTEINEVLASPLFKKGEDKVIKLETLIKPNTTTPTIKLPAKSFPLGHTEFLEYQQKLVSYLLDRKVDLDKYKFHFSLEERFLDRVIIPFYRGGRLIYWQARHIGDAKLRYDNAPVRRDAILFNFDQISSHSQLPLFVAEGVFDAMMVDGVALLSSQLNPGKEELLSATSRRLVFVIDKDANGRKLAEHVLEKGWEITFPPEGTEDINHSVRRFGLSWTIFELMKKARKAGDLDTITQLNINCKNDKSFRRND